MRIFGPAIWVAVASSVAAGALDPPPEELATAPVAETKHFEFRSSFLQNLHDFLYQRAKGRAAADDVGLDAPSTEAAAGWAAAEAYYREHIKERNHLFDPLMTQVRYRLAGIDAPLPEDPALGDVLAHLERAAPAYRARWWAEHDARNRRWIADVLPLITQHEAALTRRLARDYHHPWPAERLVVDVVTYVSWAGADTVTRPHHIMVSSTNEGYQRFAAFEMVFHEASHTLIGGRTGRIAELLRASSDEYDKRPPRNLWHAILFYTTGEAVRRALADSGHDGYVPYAYAQGLFDGGWSAYREPIERCWKPYLDREVDVQTAVARLIGSIYGEADDTKPPG
jgi:hypothetical protein